MVDGLAMRKEYDHEYNDNVADWVKKWDSYKVDLLKGFLDMKKMRKNNIFK